MRSRMHSTVARLTRLAGTLLILLTAMPTMAATDYRISMVNGTWLMNITTVLIQGEINGKTEILCLPKVEFASDIDRDELRKRLKDGIKKQEVVFHVYHDDLNRPIRSGNVLFASDIFLKSLKMSYFTALRSWGYRFKVSRQPPFEDRTYVQDVQSQGFLVISADMKSSQKTGDTAGAAVQPGQNPVAAGGSSGGSMSIAHLLPAGYLPPDVRRMKKELDRKLKEIKSRPFKAEEISVDPVRWAGGRMGILRPDGTATACMIEGRTATVRLPTPGTTGWLKPNLAAALASQPCEFILQRDVNGHEITRDGALVLADLYLTETGLTWNDWLQSQGLPAAIPATDPTFATGPIRLTKLVRNGTWQGLKAPALCAITFTEPSSPGTAPAEVMRISPAEKPFGDFRAFASRLAVTAPLQTAVNVTLLVCPDGSVYQEMGQKRAHRIYFPGKQSTLMMLMNAAAKP
ncbi:MAG TPA: hypothetical protein VIV61_12355 [Candidatus Ozemobacteraceae bacterium]